MAQKLRAFLKARTRFELGKQQSCDLDHVHAYMLRGMFGLLRSLSNGYPGNGGFHV